MLPTPISAVTIDGRAFFVKRDDLIDPYLSGNKYRKLYTLVHTPKERFDTVISYGGTQSNAMLSIAKLCFDKGWRFLYYTKPLSQRQKEEVSGNFRYALEFGMEHKEVPHAIYKEFIASLTAQTDDRTFLLHQGGAVKEAKAGIAALAKEIQKQNPPVKALATPSGTGTTALFLALALPQYRVYTTPCVGDGAYLTKQMEALGEIPKNLVVLEPPKKHPFGKPNLEFYKLYVKLLEQTGIEFDLLYAPSMWKMVLEKTTEKILYIHSGGVIGNESMLKRYQKGSIKGD